MATNLRSRYELPQGWVVRYDYHEHPRGLSAIVADAIGEVRGIGFAKFNPRDPEFKASTGQQIALGRALARVATFDQHGRPVLLSKLAQELGLTDGVAYVTMRGAQREVYGATQREADWQEQRRAIEDAAHQKAIGEDQRPSPNWALADELQ